MYTRSSLLSPQDVPSDESVDIGPHGLILLFANIPNNIRRKLYSKIVMTNLSFTLDLPLLFLVLHTRLI